MLNITKTGQDGILTVALDGRLDTMTAPELERSIMEDIEGVTELTIDMKELDYISSAGLRVLLGAQKTMNSQGKMTVKEPNEVIREIFDDTGFSNILDIR